MSGNAEAEKKKVAAAVKEPKPKAAKASKAADTIISQVRQAALSDKEVQALIDILLLKQVRIFIQCVGSVFIQSGSSRKSRSGSRRPLSPDPSLK